MVSFNLKVLAKFGLCSNCLQKLDGCSLAHARKIFCKCLSNACACKNKHSARMLAVCRKDHSIPLSLLKRLVDTGCFCCGQLAFRYHVPYSWHIPATHSRKINVTDEMSTWKKVHVGEALELTVCNTKTNLPILLHETQQSASM